MKRREFLVATGAAVGLSTSAVPSRAAHGETGDARDVAREFFEGLRSVDRAGARGLMTAAAAEKHADRASALMTLPTPADGRGAIRPARPRVDGDLAEVRVTVKAGRRNHLTTLHLKREDEAWRVFALSASYPDGDRSINFEAESEIADSSEVRRLVVGYPMPLEGVTLAGSPLEMTSFAGRVVLVDFWATWCPPCRAEIPNIRETFEKRSGDGFDVIAISVDQDLARLRQFSVAERLPWTVVADRHGGLEKPMGERYGITGIPKMVLLGRDGNVASLDCRGAALGREVDRLLRA